MSLISNLQNLRKEIHDTAINANHHPDAVRLVIVTKTVPPERVLEAYRLGERDFGENRVQEWQEKKDALPADIRWHLIGHLQTNKVKYVIGKVALIHSLDRIELADEIEKQARARGVAEVPCLVQVNMSGEETKSGVEPGKARELVAALAARPSIQVKGLMTIGPLTEDRDKVRKCFRETRGLFEELKIEYPQYPWEVLSMGMSADYDIAIEEGSNLLRIGTLVFGQRS